MTNLRLEYRDVSELNDNPANWRTHPKNQVEGLQAAIEEVGWAGALLYNETTGRLIDGHARKHVSQGKVPVLIGSWTEDQEKLILATLDPLAAQATTDQQALDELLQQIETDSAALNAMLEKMASEDPIDDQQLPPSTTFEVIVECQNPEQQEEIYNRMTGEGYTCRVLTF